MMKQRFSVFALCAVGLLGGVISGCHAEAKLGNSEPKAATPPPPPPPAPPPPPVEAAPAKPKLAVMKLVGKAKIVNNEIQIPGKIQFDTDKATIKDTAETQEIVTTLAQVLKENPQITKVRIEGHTDDKGTVDHNNKLSQGRADAVATYLTSQGIDKSRLATVGFGPSKPLVANDSDAHREQNRRTEFKIWEIDGKPTDAAKADTTATTPAGATSTTTTTTTTTPAAKK